MHTAPQHSFTRSFIHSVKVLTVEYFMCDNTTNEDELHSETLLFPNGTPQSRSFGRDRRRENAQFSNRQRPFATASR